MFLIPLVEYYLSIFLLLNLSCLLYFLQRLFTNLICFQEILDRWVRSFVQVNLEIKKKIFFFALFSLSKSDSLVVQISWKKKRNAQRKVEIVSGFDK